MIGTGAVGGYYGARLAAAGHPLQFLARSDAEVLRRDGLRVRSGPGPDVTLAPGSFGVVTDPHEAAPADVVLVALKSTANAALPDLLGPLAGPGTTVVVLQNGLGVDEVAAAAAPRSTILAGLCFICAQRERPGVVEHLDYGAITLAARTADGSPAGTTPRLEAVAADFTAAGVEVGLRPDLLAARWQKLMWNIPYNGLSVVLDATTAELSADPAARALVERLMDEVSAAADAQGHPVGADFGARMRANTEAMVPYAPSMKLDHDAGRPMEVAAIYEVPVRVAAQVGAPMPTVAALADQLRFLDARSLRRADGTSPATRS